MTPIKKLNQVVPKNMTPKEIEMARVAQQCIMESLDHSKAVVITLTDKGTHPTIELPTVALRFIGQLLGAISEGKSITLTPSQQEFTTIEAANFMNVSRPFVVKEIEAGKIKHRMVGTHRRIAVEDLIEYMNVMQQKQQDALDRMADNARELGLDY
jgi:excisionase family DNA binding protein